MSHEPLSSWQGVPILNLSTFSVCSILTHKKQTLKAQNTFWDQLPLERVQWSEKIRSCMLVENVILYLWRGGALSEGTEDLIFSVESRAQKKWCYNNPPSLKACPLVLRTRAGRECFWGAVCLFQGIFPGMLWFFKSLCFTISLQVFGISLFF